MCSRRASGKYLNSKESGEKAGEGVCTNGNVSIHHSSPTASHQASSKLCSDSERWREQQETLGFLIAECVPISLLNISPPRSSSLIIMTVLARNPELSSSPS